MPRSALALAAVLLLARWRASAADGVLTFQPSNDAPDPRYSLALEEARRKIDYQVRTVEGLRTRAMALAGFTVVTATFFLTLLGRVGTNSEIRWSPWMILGLVALALGVGCCAVVLRPRDFRFTIAATSIIAEIETGMDSNSAARWLATSEHENSVTNDDKIHRMARRLTDSLGLYGAGVVLLLVDLFGRG